MNSPCPFIRIVDIAPCRTIVIDRAAKHNALDASMMCEIAAAVRGAPAAGATLVVLRSSGERVFCAGGDLDEIGAGGDTLQAWEAGFESLADALDSSTLPLLTVAPGRVLGGGIALLALSDVVLASTDTVLDFAEYRLGVYPAMLHALLAHRLPGPAIFQLCVGARRLSAQEALQSHLATELLPADGFAHAVEPRIAYHAERAEALRLGRVLARSPLRASARERLAAVASLATEHFRSDAVRALMARAGKKT